MKKEQILLAAWNCMLAYNPTKELSHEICDWDIANFVDECNRIYSLQVKSEYVNWHDMEDFWNKQNNEKPLSTYIIAESSGDESDPDDLVYLYKVQAESPEAALNKACEKELNTDFLKIQNINEISNL